MANYGASTTGSPSTPTPKIRTVIWDFCGEPIPKPLLASLTDLSRQMSKPQARLKKLLDLLYPEEVEALRQRLHLVLTDRVYPGLPNMRGRRRF